jgi:mono/diheme cytochrome c family protein
MIRTAGTVFTLLLLSSAARAQDAALVERGRKLYASERCAVCHSIAGKGNVKGPLDGVGSRLTVEELRLWMVAPAEITAKTKATRKPPMKAYTHLPKEDVDAIVAYMQSLKQ